MVIYFILFALFLLVLIIFYLVKDKRNIVYSGNWEIMDYKTLENNDFEIMAITSCGRVCIFHYNGKWDKVSGDVKMDQNVIDFLYKKRKSILDRETRSGSLWSKISYYE